MSCYLISAMTVRERIGELLTEHGSYRAASEATKVDHAYLCRLHKGEKSHPSERMLRRLGLVPMPYYRRSQKAALARVSGEGA